MVDLAGRLLEKRAIPQIAAKQIFITSLQDEATWQRATVGFIETVRRELRLLVGFLDPRAKRRRVTQFVRDHQDHLTIAKLRTNKPLTPPTWTNSSVSSSPPPSARPRRSWAPSTATSGASPPSSGASSASTARPPARPSQPS